MNYAWLGWHFINVLYIILVRFFLDVQWFNHYILQVLYLPMTWICITLHF